MSYSFSVTAATKPEAFAKIAEEFDKVIVSQPMHAADRKAATDAAEAFVEKLRDLTEGEQVMVMVSGSLGWEGEGADATFTHASVNINASISRS